MDTYTMSKLKFDILKELYSNQWFNEDSESHDFSFEYFYNYFKNTQDNLSEEELDQALWELRMDDYVIVELVKDGYNIDIIRDITQKGIEYCKNHR